MTKIKVKKTVNSTVTYTVLIILSLIWIIPLIWMVLQSFSSDVAFSKNFFPTGFTFANYSKLFSDTRFQFGSGF